MARNLLVDGELILFGMVGSDFFDEGFTAEQVVRALAEHGRSKALTVRVNSGGGFLDDGKAIFNALRAHRGKVTCYIEGVAASAASVLCCGAGEIIMRLGTTMMIHNPQAFAMGDIGEFEKSIAMLEAETAVMIDIYAEQTGRDAEDIAAEMEAETWLTPEQAKEKGYCDKIEKGAKAIKASAFPYRQLYANAPGEILALADSRGWSRAKVRKDKPMATRPAATATNQPPRDPNQQDPNEPAPVRDPAENDPTRRDPPQPDPGQSQSQPLAAHLIADRCNAAGVPALASALIRVGATDAMVTTRINESREIRTVVANARRVSAALDPAMADQLIAAGASLEHAKAVVHDTLAAIQAASPTNSTHRATPPAPGGQQAAGSYIDQGNDQAAADAAWDKAINKVNRQFKPATKPLYA